MPDRKPETPADEEGDPKPTDLPEREIPGKPIPDMAPPGQDEPEDPEQGFLESRLKTAMADIHRDNRTADPLSPPEDQDSDSFEEEDPPDDPAQDADDADPLAPMKPAWPVE